MGSFVRSCLMLALILTLDTGCMQARHAYVLPTRRFGWCSAKLGQIDNGIHVDALYRSCIIGLVPPFYWCYPLSGFVSEFAVQSRTTDVPLTVSIERYEIITEAGIVECKTPPSEMAPWVFTISQPIGRTGIIRRALFPALTNSRDVSLHVRGVFSTSADSEPFDCVVALAREDTPLRWAGP